MNSPTTPTTEISLAQIQEYLRVVRREKWWIYLMTVGMTLTAFVGIALLPNKYRATTTVEVDPQRVPEQFVSELVRVSPLDRLQAISQEVLSATRLQKVIDQWDLYPQMRKTSAQEAVTEQMKNDITIEVKQSGGGLALFSITYVGKEPSLVASVANQLAFDFIESNLQSRERQAVGTTEFLSQQLQEAKSALEQQEAKVSQYKMSHLGELPQQQEALLHTVSGLQVELQANENNLNRLEEERLTLSQLPDFSMPGGNPRPVSERARLEMEKNQLETRLSELHRRYTDAFPEVQDVLRRLNQVSESLNALPADKPSETETPTTTKHTAAEIRLQSIARETQRLKEEQKRIQEKIATYQAKVEAIPRREQEMTDLMRNYDISKARYESLLNKSYAADMSNELDSQHKGETYKVLDRARVPERPFKPNRLQYMAASFFMSFFCSIAVIVVKEYLDPRVKTEREVRAAYPEPIPLLAAIPHIQSPMERRRHLQFVAFALSASILAIGTVAGLLWKIHPIL